MKRTRLLLLSVVLILPMTAAPDTNFSVADLLDVRTVNIAALSDDGKWLAATSGSLRDRIGIDNHRFGDPTYIAPNRQDVLIIETSSGKSQKLFPDRRQVSGLAWSPNGAQLALLALSGDIFHPLIWDPTTGKMTTVAMPAGKIAAENAELRWSPDGERLLITLRP